LAALAGLAYAPFRRGPYPLRAQKPAQMGHRSVDFRVRGWHRRSHVRGLWKALAASAENGGSRVNTHVNIRLRECRRFGIGLQSKRPNVGACTQYGTPFLGTPSTPGSPSTLRLHIRSMKVRRPGPMREAGRRLSARGLPRSAKKSADSTIPIPGAPPLRLSQGRIGFRLPMLSSVGFVGRMLWRRL
jgi:hypothetical protein